MDLENEDLQFDLELDEAFPEELGGADYGDEYDNQDADAGFSEMELRTRIPLATQISSMFKADRRTCKDLKTLSKTSYISSTRVRWISTMLQAEKRAARTYTNLGKT